MNQTTFNLIASNNSCISQLYDSIECCMTLILKMFALFLQSKYFYNMLFRLMRMNQTTFFLITSNNSCISQLYDSIECCMTLILKMFR